MTETFSLLLAPYPGDEPPSELQAAAQAYFYPPAVVYLQTPAGVEARLPLDVERLAAAARRDLARQATGPLPAPLAFLANPTESAVDLVWDEPNDARIDGYEIQWREQDQSDWNTTTIARARRHRVSGLVNGAAYTFQARAIGMNRESDWTQPLTVTVGPVKPAGILSNAADMKLSTILKTLHYINVHLLTTP